MSTPAGPPPAQGVTTSSQTPHAAHLAHGGEVLQGFTQTSFQVKLVLRLAVHVSDFGGCAREHILENRSRGQGQLLRRTGLAAGGSKHKAADPTEGVRAWPSAPRHDRPETAITSCGRGTLEHAPEHPERSAIKTQGNIAKL